MRSQFYRLTTLCLAALYGLVGLTGESLHYLAQDFGTAFQQVAARSIERHRGYFHTHSPDHHQHFHHHSHGVEVADTSSESDNSGIAFKTHQQFHSQHACPLLGILSNLKLSSGVVSTLLIEPNATLASFGEFSRSHVFNLASQHHARGPPVTDRVTA